MEQRILGDYRVIKRIGAGSLGQVFLAEHRFMRRHYCIKVLPEELASDRSFIQRFETEVGLLSSLDHPHIVKIHNISFAQGVYFLVTDCIVDAIGETTNLGQYFAARGYRLGEEELLGILRQVADALDYAHSKQTPDGPLAHRNLKLSNLLVGGDKGGLRVYLADFGLSRIIGTGAVLSRTFKSLAEALSIGTDRYAVGADSTKLGLLHNSFLQSYFFLAPEQKRLEDVALVGPKADTYAFGVLAYYLISGQFPEGIFDMPSQLAPDYRKQWDTLVMGCLRVDPERRPASLGGLLESAPTVSQFMSELTSSARLLEPIVPPPPPPPRMAQEALSVEVVPVAVLAPPTELPAVSSSAKQAPVTARVTQYRPEPQQEAHDIEPLLTDMIVVEGSSYYRGNLNGNRDEMPRHRIHINSFAIDTHPVTNEQFVRFLEWNGSEKDPNHNDIIRLRESRIKRRAGQLGIESGYSKHPVVGVTWYGAYTYAKWVRKRLPTEAEWEIAARGGLEEAIYPTGDSIEKPHANFFSSDTTAVMSYVPNGYGLYDMVGNVYEWCQDWYSYNYYETSAQEPDNPRGPLQGVYRVLRGGCWKSLKEDLRCSHRHRNNPGTVNATYGFRCAAHIE